MTEYFMNQRQVMRAKAAAVSNTVKLLATQGVKVTQRGDQPYVAHNEHTGKVEEVNIPLISEDSSIEYVNMINGFIDHEVLGHEHLTEALENKRIVDQLESRAASEGISSGIVKHRNKTLNSLRNLLEDGWIERDAKRGLPGVQKNLKDALDGVNSRLNSPESKSARDHLEGDSLRDELWNLNAMNWVRAVQGDENAQDWMRENRAEEAVQEYINKYFPPDLEDRIKKISSTAEACDLAAEMEEHLYQVIKNEIQDPGDEPGDEQKGKKGQKGDQEGDDSQGKGSPDNSDSDEDEQEEDAGGKQDDKEDEPEDESEDEPEDEDGDSDSGKGDDDDDESPPEKSLEEALEAVADKSKSMDMSDNLQDLTIKIREDDDSPETYKVLTKEFDFFGRLPNDTGRNLDEIDSRTRQMTGSISSKLQRVIASRDVSRSLRGQRKGRIDSSNVRRILQGDDRIFRQRKRKQTTRSTAISLLVDFSGSMGGDKIRLASISAYALGCSLQQLGVPFELSGFTTYRWRSPSAITNVTGYSDEEMSKIRSKFPSTRWHRDFPLCCPILKRFDETFSTLQKESLLPYYYHGANLEENIDGESLLLCKNRLVRRKEKKKVIIVLSDGQPAGLNYHDDKFLQLAVKECEQEGVNLVGIGIRSDAVKRYYKNHSVIEDFEDLPGRVMDEVTKQLL